MFLFFMLNFVLYECKVLEKRSNSSSKIKTVLITLIKPSFMNFTLKEVFHFLFEENEN